MKRTNSMLGICLLAGGMIGCAEGDLSSDPGNPEPLQQPVPITLQAGNRTKAVVTPGEAFDPLLVCFRLEGMYEKPIWTNNAKVNEVGAVSFTGFSADEGPLYPQDGPFDVYITGLHPQGADLRTVPGSAQYAIDGTKDIMYAPEVFGNYQDGHRIHGNIDPLKDKPLVFEHLLTQLQFKACRTGDANAKEFKITRITLQAVPNFVTISLADGSFTVAETKEPLNAPVNSASITSTDDKNPNQVGYVLVPAAEKYIAEVETTLGTFSDVQIKPESGALGKGKAHAITLKLTDKGLIVSRVMVANWVDVEGGEIEL